MRKTRLEKFKTFDKLRPRTVTKHRLFLMSDAIVLLHTPGPLTERLGRSMATAFSDAPDYSLILAGHHDRVAALSWFFGTFAARLTLRYGSIHSTEDGSAGIFVFAPGQSPSPMALLRAGVFSFPARFGFKSTWRAFALGIAMERQRLALAPMPHWYVLAVGVSPQKQGRGIGYSLVTHVINRAEADGVPCYLEAFEKELVIHYQQRGFHVLRKSELSNGLTLWCLLRPVSTVLAQHQPTPAPV